MKLVLEGHPHVSDADLLCIFSHDDHTTLVSYTLTHASLCSPTHGDIVGHGVRLVRAVPIGRASFCGHELSKLGHIAGLIGVVKRSGHLPKLGLLVLLKHLDLHIHPFDQLLFLVVESSPSLLHLFEAISMLVECDFVDIERCVRLVALQVEP